MTSKPKRSKIGRHQTQFFIVDCKDKSLGKIIAIKIDQPFQNVILSQSNDLKN